MGTSTHSSFATGHTASSEMVMAGCTSNDGSSCSSTCSGSIGSSGSSGSSKGVSGDHKMVSTTSIYYGFTANAHHTTNPLFEEDDGDGVDDDEYDEGGNTDDVDP